MEKPKPDEAQRKRLGRGLAALIGDVAAPAPSPIQPVASNAQERRGKTRAPVEQVRPNPRNPRQTFPEADLEDLAASIRERGIIQPIVVRAKGELFEIIAGERRWRAAQRAGLHEVPVVVLEASDVQSLELAIVENVQRADLNPLEEAAGYQALADDFGHSQERIASIVGKSRSHVANMVRLLKLSASVKGYIHAGKLSAGHARMLVGRDDADRLAEEIVSRGLNVRQVEALMRQDKRHDNNSAPPPKPPKIKDADTFALERRVSDTLGLTVTIDHNNDGGTLHIRYRDLDQLDSILQKLER